MTRQTSLAYRMLAWALSQLSRAVLVVAAIAVLVPFLWMLSVSARTSSDLFADPVRLWPNQWSWQGYVTIWSELPLARLAVNTFAYAGTAAAVLVLLDSMAGYAFARLEFRGRKTLFLVIVSGLMVPFQTAIVPIYLLELHLGWLNTYQGLIVPRMASALGIFLMRQFLVSLPRELDEAARIDGASNWRIFFSIILPLSKPALASLFVIQFVALWNDFLWPLVISSSVDMRTLPSALTLFSSSNSIVDYSALLAGATISIAPLALLYMFAQRYFVQGIAATGLK